MTLKMDIRATVGKALLAGALAVGGAAVAAPGSTASVGFMPPTQDVAFGATFTMDLVASGVSNGIGAWDFQLDFGTPGIARFTGITFSSSLGSGDDVITFDLLADAGGEVGAISLVTDAAALAAAQGAAFTLATLHFEAIGTGMTTVMISELPLGALLVDVDGDQIMDPGVDDGLIRVGVIPEPSTVALWLAGLAGLGVVGRRRR